MTNQEATIVFTYNQAKARLDKLGYNLNISVPNGFYLTKNPNTPFYLPSDSGFKTLNELFVFLEAMEEVVLKLQEKGIE